MDMATILFNGAEPFEQIGNFSLFSIAITSLGEKRANLSAFRRLFDLCVFVFVGFLFLLCLGRAAVWDCGTPWTFLLPRPF